MGGLLGAPVGNRFGGDYWEEVTIPPNPRLDPRRVVDPTPLSDREEAAGIRAGGAGREAP